MSNRLEIAKSFARDINCEYIDTIILYGSVARGEDNEDSDIDILIISDYEDKIKDIICEKSFQIVLDQQELISANIMSPSWAETIKNFTLMKDIRRDGIVLGWWKI